MDLELKILKEKVVDDEKKSGIGSLFDDEKTSHQHINLLKTKYMQMRADHERESQELQRKKLEVIGQQLIYNSQIQTIQDQTEKLYDLKRDFEAEMKKKLFDTDKKFKDTQKVKMNLESETRMLENENQREMQEHYRQTMEIQDQAAKGDLSEARQNRDLKLFQTR